MKIFNELKTNKFIQSVLENTRSTNLIKRNLTLGKKWLNFLFDAQGGKIYNRKKINEYATSYYTEIYRDKGLNLHDVCYSEMVQEPYIIESEIADVMGKLRRYATPGPDNIKNEQIKFGGLHLIKNLKKLFNMILEGQKIPREWKKSNIILIHKKGSKNKIENYRPISLSPIISKIFSKIILRRIQNYLNYHLSIEQAGFRKGFSTIDHLFVLNQVIEKSREYQKEICLVFVDYSKAFDSLRHIFMLDALKNQGVPLIYQRIVADMYTNLEARILTEKTGEYFCITKGVKQGDPLSPLLFICALEEVFRKLNWEQKGIKINGEILNNLRFADDVVLIGNNLLEIKNMLTELNEVSNQAGLYINMEKTKIITNVNKKK